MNSVKSRNNDTFPRVRKRNSTGNKPTSSGTLNAAQRRASLLKNNKNLALTLQETRCELAVYKNFFEESQDYMNKAKLAKSRMVQLSAALKNFVKAFDENIILLDFDDLKWPNIKVSTQPNKNFQSGMNPVIEVCNEIMEEDAGEQEMNWIDNNNPKYSDQVVQSPLNTFQKADDKEKCHGSERSSILSQKKSEDLDENNKGSELRPEIGDAEGNKDIPSEASNSQPLHPRPNSLQNSPPAPLSSQVVKKTKIPRCRPFSINLKRQTFVKEPKHLNKASKRKSSDKKYEESDSNFSRRKTFVVKSSNVLTESESIRNVLDENLPFLNERLNVPEDRLISNDKRKTFVVKPSNILQETEPVFYLNKVDRELVTEIINHVNETTDVQDVLTSKKNKRKTFVKKSNDETVLHQDDVAAEYQVSFPIRECAVNLEPVENCEVSYQSENIKSSSDFHHSETLTGFAAVESEQFCAESSKKNELNTVVSSLNMSMISGASSKEVIENEKISITDGSDASDKTEVMARNLQSIIDKVVQDAAEAAEKDIDIINEELIFNDESRRAEDSNKVSDLSLVKTCGSLFDSAELGEDLYIIDEFDFGDKQPAFKTTPIRRKISKSKKKIFVFDGNKKNPKAGDNHSQKKMEISNSNAVNNNEIRETNVIVSVSNENPVNIPLETGTLGKKTIKTSSRKIKSSRGTSIKNNTEKNTTKLKKVKNNKVNKPAIEIDDLLSKPKKIKKKNIKKKKKEDIYDDNAICKFVDVDEVVKLNEVKESETELESDFLFKKIGENTFLVRAEVHTPPPSFNTPGIEEINKEDDKLRHMQVAVVLSDVLKSKDIELLNISDIDLLNDRAPSVKSLSGSSNSFVIDPEESIEKLRCDPVAEADDCDLHSDAILDIAPCEIKIEPVFEIENPRGRRRKQITYAEPSLRRKMRRC